MDPTLCPLCGQPNRCAMEVQKQTGEQQPPCWCTQVDFGADLLATLPPQARDLACICAACQAASSRALNAPQAAAAGE